MQTIDIYGSSLFCIPAAELLLNAGYALRIVTTVPPSTHKSRTPVITALKEFATIHKLPIAEIQTRNNLLNLYTQWAPPECAVVASFGRILPPALLRIPKKHFLNIHPSLLPLHRGPSPVQSTIINGDTVTGSTIIVLDTQVDHGPILTQEVTEIGEGETAEALKARLAQLGAKLILNILPQWLEGTLRPQSQDDALATFSTKISKEDGRIDWSSPAITIERQWRAYTPWPGIWTTLTMKPNQPPEIIKLYDAALSTITTSSHTPVGSILEVTPSGTVLVQAGEDTVVSFKSIQRPGRNKMSIPAFVQGFPQILTSMFI